MINSIIKFLFNYKVVKFLISLYFILRGNVYLLKGRIYYGLSDLCWVYRVSDINLLKKIVLPKIKKEATGCFTDGKNRLVEQFLETLACENNANRYTLSGKGHLDIFRDIIVLKSPFKNEKGVILVGYGETYDAMIAFFDISKILESYFIVLEMSWSGTCDPSYLMFLNPHNKVIVQTPEEDDYCFLKNLDSNIIPIRMGSGDWTDIDEFELNVDSHKKEFDIGMIANWSKTKNHKKLFEALRKVKTRPLNLLLIGFPWRNRTRKDIEKEFETTLKKHSDGINLTIKENVKHSDIKNYFAKTKVTLLLSQKEGFNKAVMESLFCNTPIIVYNKHKGGAKEQVCEETGLTSSFEKLHKNIEFMLQNYSKFSTRKYIEKVSGSKISTYKLNNLLKLLSEGSSWTTDIEEKVKCPNLEYKNRDVRDKFKSDYDFLMSCIRNKYKPN